MITERESGGADAFPRVSGSARSRNVLSTNRNSGEFAADRQSASQNAAAAMPNTLSMRTKSRAAGAFL
jgi:hypothetical protein